MKSRASISLLFTVAAIYDALLGGAFLFFGTRLFEWFGVIPPNHLGYLHFPAALLLVFALMFVAIARDPYANRNLLPYAMLLKLSYCGVVLFHWASTGIPFMWKPFCLLDLIFLVLFAWAAASLRGTDKASLAGH
jgi:hypothetical protein